MKYINKKIIKNKKIISFLKKKKNYKEKDINKKYIYFYFIFYF